MQKKTKVLLIYEAFAASIRLCGYEQLSYLAAAGRICLRHGTEDSMTQEQCQWADAVVFIRSSSWLAWKIAGRCQLAGKWMLYVLDDDLLGVAPDTVSAKYYRQPSVRNRICWFLKNCDVLVSPSRYLLRKYQGTVKRTVRIEEPCMGHAGKRKKETNCRKLKIGFAGSIDRTSDVQNILEEVLEEFYQKHHAQVSIEFMGIQPAVAQHMGFTCYSFEQDYEKYQKKFHQLDWDVGLAPMPDSPFHRCKHYNKYIEYGAAGCVGIYSDVIPYRYVIRDKENGILCPNRKEDWIHALEWCLQNREKLDEMREKIQDDMEKHYQVGQAAERLAEQIPELTLAAVEKKIKIPAGCYKKIGWGVRVLEFLARNLVKGRYENTADKL